MKWDTFRRLFPESGKHEPAACPFWCDVAPKPHAGPCMTAAMLAAKRENPTAYDTLPADWGRAPAATCTPGCRHAGQEKHPATCEPAPASMLGEALWHAKRARALALSAKSQTAHDQGLYARADGFLDDVEETLHELKTGAEAREAQATPVDRSCHYSGRGMPEHDLGEGPAECLMCTAKRAEGRARAAGPDGHSCLTCGREFATSSARDGHQATAHGRQS